MTNGHGFPGSWPPGMFRGLLVILLVLAGSLRGSAQTEFSEHDYNMFRSFYYDSMNVAIELAGKSEVHLSPEDFGKLPEDSRREGLRGGDQLQDISFGHNGGIPEESVSEKRASAP